MGLLDAGMKLSNAPGPFNGPGSCSREREPSLRNLLSWWTARDSRLRRVSGDW